jgi:hypothetical protein
VRFLDARFPERRLADPRPARENERAVRVAAQEGAQQGELAVPADDARARRRVEG